jgi:hypothetical protein
VQQFWRQVDSVACTEQVTQEKINQKGKPEYSTESTYDYVAFAGTHEGRLTVEEMRVALKRSNDKAEKPSLLATNGFPTLLLIFHPQYQRNYRFHLESGSSNSDPLIRVHFDPVAGGRSTCALALKDRIYPLSLKGSAWIDRETGSVQKLVAELVAPLNDINIEAFHIEVVYKPQSFPSALDPVWLPMSVTVDLRTALQRWKNVHLFSHYKRFSVISLESEVR